MSGPDFHTPAGLEQWPLAAGLALCTLIYLYFRHKFSFWRRRGLTNPTPLPWFGTSLWPLVTPKPELELQLHRKHGKLYGLFDGFLGTNPTLVCGHPEALKQISIKYFDSFKNRRRPATWKAIRYRALTYMRDDEWKATRKIIGQTFTSTKLKKMFELMRKCTKNLENSVAHESPSNEIDLKRLFSVFTVDVISVCCFSMDLKDYRHPDSEILTSARRFFSVSRIKMLMYAAMPKQLLASSGFDINDVDSINFFARFAQEIINKRRQLSAAKSKRRPASAACGAGAGYKKQEDFLQFLIDAAAEFSERKQRPPTSEPAGGAEPALEGAAPTTTVGGEQELGAATAETAASGKPVDEEVASTTEHVTGAAPTDGDDDDDRDDDDDDDDNINNGHAYTGNSHHEQNNNNNNDVGGARPPASKQPVRQPSRPEAGNYSEQQLGDLEILAQSMLFFAVGHETTATLLSSCGFFLALYPELQERLYAEVHQAIVEDKGEIGYERLLELKYLDAFISEALRYYTPTLVFDREASEDVEIEYDNKKLFIPKGMGVVIPFHAIHHDPDNWDEPERFDPERFMPQNKHKIKPCTYIPFGSGPRHCLASRFALIEAKLALANLVNRFRFVKSEGTVWPPTYRHHYMLLQMEWPKIKFVDRKLDQSEGLLVSSQAQMAA